MRNYQLTIITENQKQLRKAEEVAALIQVDLAIQPAPEITKYDKFPNSWKIKFSGKFKSDSEFISEADELTDRIASPWTVRYIRPEGEIELLFNHSPHCQYSRLRFNVVHWAHFEIF